MTEIVRGANGEILNAADLQPDQLLNEKVLCPGCKDKVFQAWPEGWDQHAANLCDMPGGSPDARTEEYRRRYSRLFAA